MTWKVRCLMRDQVHPCMSSRSLALKGGVPPRSLSQGWFLQESETRGCHRSASTARCNSCLAPSPPMPVELAKLTELAPREVEPAPCRLDTGSSSFHRILENHTPSFAPPRKHDVACHSPEHFVPCQLWPCRSHTRQTAIFVSHLETGFMSFTCRLGTHGCA